MAHRAHTAPRATAPCAAQGDAPVHGKQAQQLYKTELCKNFAACGFCRCAPARARYLGASSESARSVRERRMRLSRNGDAVGRD